MHLRFRNDRFEGEIVTTEQTDVKAFFDFLSKTDSSQDCIALAPTTKNEALGLMTIYVECLLLKKTEPHPLIVQWLVLALADTVVSANPSKQISKSLGLTASRTGRPNSHGRATLVGNRMRELVTAGTSVLNAKLQCAEEVGIHEATAEKAYYQLLKWEASMPF